MEALHPTLWSRRPNVAFKIRCTWFKSPFHQHSPCWSMGELLSISEPLFSLVQSLGRVQLFATPWTAACQASLSIINSRSFLKLTSIDLVMPSNHLILCRPLLPHLQYFPASGSFPVSQFFSSSGQSIGVSASASLLPMNIQD